jgi:hypothetical protein
MAMSETANVREPVAPRAGWLDRWCAVRWRACVTWVVLAGVMAYSYFKWDLLGNTVRLLNGYLPAGFLQALPFEWHLPLGGFLLTWYQPFLLRLGLFRGSFWVLLGAVADAL